MTTGTTGTAGTTAPGHTAPTACIEKPTPFGQWIQTKQLFDDGAAKTETYVTDGHEEGTRYAYGKSSRGWCFYIVMEPSQEPEFLRAYQEWRKHNPNGHHHMAVAVAKPPNCGTPNTPPCEAITAVTSMPGSESPNTSGGVKAA